MEPAGLGAAQSQAYAVSPPPVVGERFDPATPYENAVTVTGLLPNASLLTVHGWGHSILASSESTCANEAVARYLVNLETPAAGTVCELDFMPFAQ